MTTIVLRILLALAQSEPLPTPEVAPQTDFSIPISETTREAIEAPMPEETK